MKQQADMERAIKFLNKHLMTTALSNDMPVGLFYGKMGICIYFFIIARKNKSKEYQVFAENLLDKIFEEVKYVNAIDVKNGLSGIGLGIHYLVKEKYVTGSINTILEDVDNTIFKHLCYTKYSEHIDFLSLVHITYYLYVRIKDFKQNSDSEYLYKELIIQAVNLLYQKFRFQHQEVHFYNFDYELPQFLYVYSKVFMLNIYNERIAKMLEEISAFIHSHIPIRYANRLYLLWGVCSIEKVVSIEGWHEYLTLLKSQTDVNVIFDTELRDRNIYYNDGLVSLYFLLNALKEHYSHKELKKYEQIIVEKIVTSEAWSMLQNDELYFSKRMGIYGGYCGVALLLTMFLDKNKEHEKN